MALTVACDIHPLNNLRVLKYLTGRAGPAAGRQGRMVRHWVSEGLAALEAMAAPRAGAFLFGDAPTLADICLVPQLYNARRFDVPLDDYPTLLRADENASAHRGLRRRPSRPPGASRMNRVDDINRGMDEDSRLAIGRNPVAEGQGQRRGMGDPRRPRRRLPAGRALRLGRPHLHPFVGAHPRARASFPAQPLPIDVRGSDRRRRWSRSTSTAIRSSRPRSSPIRPASPSIRRSTWRARMRRR